MSPVPLLSFVGGLFPEVRVDYFSDLHKWRTGLFTAVPIRVKQELPYLCVEF